MSENTPTLSYFQKRMQLMGVTDDLNQVNIWRSGKTFTDPSELVPCKVFREVEKGIEIFVPTLDRHANVVTREGKRWKEDFCITRLEVPITKPNGDEIKYLIPKGTGTFPFFPPALIDKYDAKQKIKTLVITEGYFKAFKAAMHGLDIVGLSSITHYKEKDKGTLHEDIVKLIKTCEVENVIWLADGDCNRISLKALEKGEDLYKRPNQFFQSGTTIKRLLDDYDVHKYFAYVNSLNVAGMPKGLDDLLIALPGKEKDIVDDLLSLSKSSMYFWREDMSYSAAKVRKHFHLHSINEFVEYHCEQLREIAKAQGEDPDKITDLKKKEFMWNGTQYRWNNDKNECDIMVPGDAKKYFRVGDQYHEKIPIPNKYGELEHTFHRRQKQTIIDDYGKPFCAHIPKYKAFCNVPDHMNYQEVISNCYNMYYPFEHEPEVGDYENTMNFLKHIFGTGHIKVKQQGKDDIEISELDLGLDYIQLLFQQPQQTLPILCLVSRENGTGKTTFAKWLKLIFTQNVAIVGNAELANDFNASWAGKLLVICDEAKIDKQVVVERVKSLSTADKIFMNAKGKDHVEIDFFAKFLFLTNNEENFIYAGEDDVRYWVRKVPVIKELFVGMLTEMKMEIPAFLDFLNKRKLASEQLHRAWFHPDLIKTEALKKVIAFSQSTVEKELRMHIRDIFFDHGVSEVMMTLESINETFFRNKYERNYLRNVVTDKLKADLYHEWEWRGVDYRSLDEIKTLAGDAFVLDECKKKYKTKRHSFPKWERLVKDGKHIRERVYVSDNGRPYVFHIDKFLLQEEITTRWIDPETASDAEINSNDIPAEGVGVAQLGRKNKQLDLGTGGPGRDDLPF